MMQDLKEILKQNFPVWYNKVCIGNEADRVQKRLAGIAALAKAANDLEIEALVRIAFNAKQPPDNVTITQIRQHFKSADELFEMQNNDSEMQLLSGASLWAIMANAKDDAATAALSVTIAEFGGARKIKLPMDLVETANYALVALAEANRKRPELVSTVAAPKVDFTTAGTKAKESPNGDGYAAAFTLAANLVNESLATITNKTRETFAATKRFISIQDEELQMLWWLMGERSHYFDKPFTKISANTQPLVFAKELADSTELLPGPASISGLLYKAGIKESKKLSIPDVVNACDSDWLQSLVDNTKFSPVTQPIHCAIDRKLETGDTNSWIAGWAGVTNIKADFLLSPLMIANLFYRERLLTIFN